MSHCTAAYLEMNPGTVVEFHPNKTVEGIWLSSSSRNAGSDRGDMDRERSIVLGLECKNLFRKQSLLSYTSEAIVRN